MRLPAQTKLADVEARIPALEKVRDGLTRLIAACPGHGRADRIRGARPAEVAEVVAVEFTSDFHRGGSAGRGSGGWSAPLAMRRVAEIGGEVIAAQKPCL
jgi:hypothetical protein